MPRWLTNAIASTVAMALVAPIVAVLVAIPTFFVMLALGAAHDQWPAIPALGFWTTFLILNGLGWVSRVLRGVGESKDEDDR